jgi:hypothetical protein
MLIFVANIYAIPGILLSALQISSSQFNLGGYNITLLLMGLPKTQLLQDKTDFEHNFLTVLSFILDGRSFHSNTFHLLK